MEHKAKFFTESNAYYNNKIAEFGSSAKGLNWKDAHAQRVRFEQLVKVLQDTGPFTINDLGCGFGDFYAFLKDKNLAMAAYNGYDISAEVIDIAAKQFPDQPDCNFYVIQDEAQLKESDYTVASGIFNLKFNTSEDEWLHYILRNMAVMFNSSRKGCAFNFLTKYSDKEFMRQDLYYADPCFIFDYCKKRLSKDVAVLHDYHQYDFTVIVRK